MQSLRAICANLIAQTYDLEDIEDDDDILDVIIDNIRCENCASSTKMDFTLGLDDNLILCSKCPKNLYRCSLCHHACKCETEPRLCDKCYTDCFGGSTINFAEFVKSASTNDTWYLFNNFKGPLANCNCGSAACTEACLESHFDDFSAHRYAYIRYLGVEDRSTNGCFHLFELIYDCDTHYNGYVYEHIEFYIFITDKGESKNPVFRRCVWETSKSHGAVQYIYYVDLIKTALERRCLPRGISNNKPMRDLLRKYINKYKE